MNGLPIIFCGIVLLLESTVVAADPHEILVSVKIDVAACSADGKLLAVGGPDGTVKVLETATGKEVLSVQVGRLSISVLAFSRNGRLLAAGNGSGLVAVVELANRSIVREWQGDEAVITALAFANDARELVIASGNGTVRVRSLSDEAVSTIVQGDADHVTDLAVSADGRMVAATFARGGLKFWKDGLSHAPVSAETMEPREPYSRCLAFNPTGDQIAVAGYRHLRTFEFPSGKRLKSEKLFATRAGENVYDSESSEQFDIAYSPDGRTIAVAQQKSVQTIVRPYITGEILMVDAQSLKTLHVFQGCRSSAVMVAFTSENKMITASYDDTVRIWEWRKTP